MKKLYTTYAALVIVWAVSISSLPVYAQVAGPQGPLQGSPSKAFTQTATIKNAAGQSKDVALKARQLYPASTAGTTQSFWLNYAFTEDSLWGNGSATLFSDYIFPDSNVIMYGPTGFYGPPDEYYIEQTLDPYSQDFQTVYNYNWPAGSTNYTVDSIAMHYLYQRLNPDMSVVDTLVVYLVNDANPMDMPVLKYKSSWGEQFSNGEGVYLTAQDTLMAEIMRYDYITNQPIAAAGDINSANIFKIPLTEADTMWTYFGLKTFSTNSFAVPAGKHVGAAFGFIPGYTYNPYDTITNNENTFQFGSWNISGFSNFPYYEGDRNVSSYLTQTTRGNYDASGYDSLFTPTYSIPAGDNPLQYHDIFFLVSAQNVGIPEIASQGGLKLYQNQPNPANHLTTFKYENQAPGAILLEVRDITGRVVMTFDQGNQPAGMHFVSLEVSGLSEGLYIYTLKTKNESLTQKMMVGN